ncbi:MAG: hypothetical protein RLZ98_1950, partial [Pseudomonadota bacterium]
DLDDTLYPERMFAVSGFRAAGDWAEREWGIGGLAERMTAYLDGGNFGKLFEMVLKDTKPDYTAEDVKALIDVWKDHRPEIALHDDALPVLEHFGRRSPMGLITDGQHEVQARKVAALDIAHRFQEIVLTNKLGGRAYHKPHPKSYEIVHAALDKGGSRFVYVGDNPAKDFVTPNRMGWLTVQIIRQDGLHDRDNVAEGGAPHHKIHSLAELLELLD